MKNLKIPRKIVETRTRLEFFECFKKYFSVFSLALQAVFDKILKLNRKEAFKR